MNLYKALWKREPKTEIAKQGQMTLLYAWNQSVKSGIVLSSTRGSVPKDTAITGNHETDPKRIKTKQNFSEAVSIMIC